MLEPNEIIIDFYSDGSSNINVYVPDNNNYLQSEIYGCIIDQTRDSSTDITTLKNEVKKICQDNGIENPDITVQSPYGEDMFIYQGLAAGISMEPTIKDGSILIFNKTRDIRVGDIVSAEYHPKHIDILKRVSVIKGDEVYLISDNVGGSYVKNGKEYAYEGLRTWVNMSDINGVLIDSYVDDRYASPYDADVIKI